MRFSIWTLGGDIYFDKKHRRKNINRLQSTEIKSNAVLKRKLKKVLPEIYPEKILQLISFVEFHLGNDSSN